MRLFWVPEVATSHAPSGLARRAAFTVASTMCTSGTESSSRKRSMKK